MFCFFQCFALPRFMFVNVHSIFYDFQFFQRFSLLSECFSASFVFNDFPCAPGAACQLTPVGVATDTGWRASVGTDTGWRASVGTDTGERGH